MTLFELALITLAVLYITHVIVKTEGPFFIFRWLRDITRRPFNRFPFALFDCFYCTVVWAALIVLWVYSGKVLILETLAVSGAASLLCVYTGLKHG